MADSIGPFDPRDLEAIDVPPVAPIAVPKPALLAAPARTGWFSGMTRKAAAVALECSESLIRKRLKQLESFHSAAALYAPDGSISEAGFVAVERLGRLGIAQYRTQYSQRPPVPQTTAIAPQQPEQGGAITPIGYSIGTGAIVPEVLAGSQGSGAMAIASDLDAATAALNAARAALEARRLELKQRGEVRDRDLAGLVGAVRGLQQEQAALTQLEILEAAKDHAADVVRQTLGNALSPAVGELGG